MKDYTPIDEWPDFNGEALGPLKFTERGEQVKEQDLFDNDYAILSYSNATPIMVTVTAPAGVKYTTGQYVQIKGSAGGVIDGDWQITVLTGTTFSLTGSTAGGAGGAGGRVWDPKRGVLSKLIDACYYLGKRLLGGSYTEVFPKLLGRKRLYRPRVTLSDADHTVKVTDGDIFELDPTPGAGRVITLSQTSPTPDEGEAMRFVCPGLTNANTYQFQRSGPVLIASFYGTALGNSCPYADFEFTGGVWRLSGNSGWNQTETQGVLAGVGA